MYQVGRMITIKDILQLRHKNSRHLLLFSRQLGGNSKILIYSVHHYFQVVSVCEIGMQSMLARAPMLKSQCCLLGPLLTKLSPSSCQNDLAGGVKEGIHIMMSSE